MRKLSGWGGVKTRVNVSDIYELSRYMSIKRNQRWQYDRVVKRQMQGVHDTIGRVKLELTSGFRTLMGHGRENATNIEQCCALPD